MASFNLAGNGGELRAGGNLAAMLGPWRYMATPDGWLLGAGMTWQDEFLVEKGAEYEVRLFTQDGVHIATDVHVIRTPGFRDRITAVGERSLDRFPRYQHGRVHVEPGKMTVLESRALRRMSEKQLVDPNFGLAPWDRQRGMAREIHPWTVQGRGPERSAYIGEQERSTKEVAKILTPAQIAAMRVNQNAQLQLTVPTSAGRR